MYKPLISAAAVLGVAVAFAGTNADAGASGNVVVLESNAWERVR